MRWPLWRVKVTEWSMEPALWPGDWVVVLRTKRIRPGQIVVARHPAKPEMLLVKRAARAAGGAWWLEADNSSELYGAVDSRAFGAVPACLIEGRVLFRYWSLRLRVRVMRVRHGVTRLRHGPTRLRRRATRRRR